MFGIAVSILFFLASTFLLAAMLLRPVASADEANIVPIKKEAQASGQNQRNSVDQKQKFDNLGLTIVQTRATVVQAVSSLLLFAVVVFQVALLIQYNEIASNSAKAAKQAAETAKDALLKVQRAYVSVDRLEQQMVDGNLIMWPVWKNTGMTPTNRLQSWVNVGWFPKAPDVFPDAYYLKASGGDINNPPPNEIFLYLSGQSACKGAEVTIPTDILASLNSGKTLVFIWGIARYNDVFGVGHFTRFCFQINSCKIVGNPPFYAAFWGKNNYTDDDRDE